MVSAISIMYVSCDSDLGHNYMPLTCGYLFAGFGQVRMRRQSRSGPARPYICLLSILMRFDVTFDGAGAPAEAEPAGNGVLVGSQAGDEGAKRGLAGGEGRHGGLQSQQRSPAAMFLP